MDFRLSKRQVEDPAVDTEGAEDTADTEFMSTVILRMNVAVEMPTTFVFGNGDVSNSSPTCVVE
jgi:hypothetical protein